MKSLSALVLGLCFAANAFAAADLSVTTTAPAGVKYYDIATYRVSVKNVGNTSSSGGRVEIDLPKTGTSPQVYTLGQVTAVPAGCTLAASRITCTFGTTKKGVTRNYDFGFKAPYSSAPIALTARVVPTWTGDPAANNLTTRTLALSGHSFTIPDGYATDIRHCTGSASLTSFFECTLFPSSISNHGSVFAAGGVVNFDVGVDPAYTGAWQQPAADQLTFQYFENGVLVAEFDGRGVGGGCFEGLTRFWDAPGVLSPYVSPYEVCPL